MTKATDNLIPMFVYGTLRPKRRGEGSWGVRGDEPIIHNAYISGGLWFIDAYGSYPLAKLDVPGRIQGDIVFFEEGSWNYERICDVESGAGYELREVEATYIEGEADIDNFVETGDFPTMTVFAWHYKHDVSKKRAVPGNNWLRAVSGERRVNR